jgi:large subunit ribosomal protein L27
MLFKKILTCCTKTTTFHPLTTIKLVETQIRHASKASAGIARYGKESNPKFRGVKVHHGQIVKPGDIIVRQKGNKFWPGYNVGQSRDFTLYALKEGCVEIVKDPVYDRRYVMVAQRKNPPPVFGIPVKRVPTSHVHLIPKVKKFQGLL